MRADPAIYYLAFAFFLGMTAFVARRYADYPRMAVGAAMLAAWAALMAATDPAAHVGWIHTLLRVADFVLPFGGLAIIIQSAYVKGHDERRATGTHA